MSRHENGREPAAKEPGQNAAQDLSAEIVNAVAREPTDLVRCVRVFGDYYRCNWWAPSARAGHSDQPHPAYSFAALATHHIRKSSFFNATVNLGKMTLREVSP